ncbi:hypothetical protein ACFE04_011333 [Oxalis oulophora]
MDARILLNSQRQEEARIAAANASLHYQTMSQLRAISSNLSQLLMVLNTLIRDTTNEAHDNMEFASTIAAITAANLATQMTETMETTTLAITAILDPNGINNLHNQIADQQLSAEHAEGIIHEAMIRILANNTIVEISRDISQLVGDLIQHILQLNEQLALVVQEFVKVNDEIADWTVVTNQTIAASAQAAALAEEAYQALINFN